MRKIAKTDSNHVQIAEMFRRLGWSWWNTHQLGGGFPDGIASKQGYNILIEIKDGSKPPSKRKLTDDEQDFFEYWQGDIRIVKSQEDVIAINKQLVMGVI